MVEKFAPMSEKVKDLCEKGSQTFIEEKLTGHTGSITALTIAPSISNTDAFYNSKNFSSGVLASASEDHTIRIWDLRISK